MLASEKLQELLEEMKKEGLEHFHVTKYEECGLSHDEFCQQVLDMLNAEPVDHVPGLFKTKDRIQTF
jgi:hypothetical protein